MPPWENSTVDGPVSAALLPEPSPEPSRSAADLALTAWTYDYLSAWWIRASFAGLAVLYLAWISFYGPMVITVAPNDDLLLLDGGWRILNGLVPHRDFYLALGSLTYLFVAGGLWLTHGSVAGLALGVTVLGTLASTAAYIVSRARLTALGCLIFTTLSLLLTTMPYPLGANSASDLTYAMVYNRLGYVLLAIVLVFEFGSVTRSHQSNQRSGGVIAGASFAALLFVKISFFGVATLFVLASLLLGRNRYQRGGWLAVGFFGFTAAMGVFLRFHFLAMLLDLKATTLSRVTTISADAHALFGFSSKLFLVFCLCSLLFDPAKRSSLQRLRLTTLCMGTMLSEQLFEKTNAWQGATFPLYVVVLLILLSQPGSSAANSRAQPGFYASLLFFGLLQISTLPFTELRSVLTLAQYKRTIPPKLGPYAIASKPVRGLALLDNAIPSDLSRNDNGRDYALYINDGLNLLRSHSTQAESVMTLGYHNPFSYLLLRKPPAGGSLWLYLGNNISIGHILKPALVFGDAKLAMIPNYPSSHQMQDKFLLETYQPYLDQNFKMVAESSWWTLYRRVTALD